MNLVPLKASIGLVPCVTEDDIRVLVPSHLPPQLLGPQEWTTMPGLHRTQDLTGARQAFYQQYYILSPSFVYFCHNKTIWYWVLHRTSCVAWVTGGNKMPECGCFSVSQMALEHNETRDPWPRGLVCLVRLGFPRSPQWPLPSFCLSLLSAPIPSWAATLC